MLDFLNVYGRIIDHHQLVYYFDLSFSFILRERPLSFVLIKLDVFLI